MASSSGTSSGSTMLQNSGSEEDLQLVMDQRKLKRMQSNRESARRSRMRKQKHLDDLMTQVAQIRKENNQIVTRLSVTTQHYLTVEAENSVLRTQMMELSNRLESLNEIINCMHGNGTTGEIINCMHGNGTTGFEPQIHQDYDCFMKPWNMAYMNQPIMASADLFQY